MCRIKNLLILKNFGIINKHNQSKNNNIISSQLEIIIKRVVKYEKNNVTLHLILKVLN